MIVKILLLIQLHVILYLTNIIAVHAGENVYFTTRMKWHHLFLKT